MTSVMSIEEAIAQMGSVLISLAIGAPRSTFAQEWADGTASPDPALQARYAVLTEQFTRVAEAESIAIARQWLIGSSIDDGNISPIEALAADRFDEVRVSATHMVNDDWFS